MKLFDGLEGAFIGVATVWHPDGSRVDRAIYDGDKIATGLEAEGLSREDALEHISFNVEGGYVGEDTPIVVWNCNIEDLELGE